MASGTPTTNLGLNIILGTDRMTPSDINESMEILDEKIGDIGDSTVKEITDALEDGKVDRTEIPEGGIQETLVSGTNIKTINNQSLLGPGNIDISGGTSDHTQLTNRSVADQHPISAITNLQSTLDGKQAQLVSGTNIKTVNGNSLLGPGNINISHGGSFDDFFPVGSFWWNSVTSSSPAGLGLSAGTWEQITDTFLLAAGINHAVGTTGGEETHTLTIAEMPRHNHATFAYSVAGSTTGYNVSNPNTGTTNETNNYPTRYAGSGGAHNNMPPYLAAYCWHRVA